MKKIIKKTHVWLGVISGVFVFLIALSGCIYAFNDEIIEFANKDVKYIPEQEKNKIAVDSLLSLVEAEGYMPRQFVYNNAADRSIYILTTDANDRFIQFYLDPYSGDILKQSNLYEFFYFVESFHTELCMGALGRAFIGFITVIFFILMLTGLSLSLRKRWSKKTFQIRWTKNNTALNYDLHKVLGLIVIIPSVVLCLTGIIMAFDPVEVEILDKIGADISYEENIEGLLSEKVDDSLILLSYQDILDRLKAFDTQIRITLPTHEDQRYILSEYGNDFGMKYADNYSFEYIDRSSGEVLILSAETKRALDVGRNLSQIHTGKLIGLPYKIVLFIISIFIISLPFTGYLFWKQTLKKKR